MSKKKRRPERPGIASTPPALIAGLEEARAHIDRKRWAEACDVLEALDQRFPQRVEVLAPLMDAYYDLEDLAGYHSACRRLYRVVPDDADITLALAGSNLVNLKPVSALRIFRQFLVHWPEHARAGEVRETVSMLEGEVDAILPEMGLTGEDALELAALHEEGNWLVEQGKDAEGRRIEEQVLRRRPDFAPSLNNISQTYAREGRYDEAIATARRVLAHDPHNFHALSNLIRYLCLSGRPEAAGEYAGRLKAIDVPGVWLKQVEALSYLGDDQGALDGFHAADKENPVEPAWQKALLYHLAAVAAMRLGREDEARGYWQQAIKIDAQFDLARENLADLRQAVGKRHAPWPFVFSQWVPHGTLNDLLASMEAVLRGGDDEAVQRGARRFLRRHPEVTGLIPTLLDRGDPDARTFALQIALSLDTPEMLAALRDFALSQRGPDEMRMRAGQAAAQVELFPPGPVSLWLEGEWREILMVGYEIHEEPSQEHAPEVEEWLVAATLALRERKAKEAEDLLRQALALEPDAPDVLNNLAVAHDLQGRRQEAEELLRQIHERHPDYVFARVSLARMAVRGGDTERAEELLKPLLTQKRFHVEEFGQFCAAQIDLFLAQRSPDAASAWLDMWAATDPDNPQVAAWRLRLGVAKRFRRLFGRRS